MKTVKELNEKVWYRVLKVFIIIFFLFIFVILEAFLYDDYDGMLDNDKSYIACNDGRNLALEANGIYLDSLDYVSDIMKKDIYQLCDHESESIVKAGIDYVESKSTFRPIYSLDGHGINYTIIPSYEVRWLEVIKFTILIVLVLLVIMEILRRIFYYIVLGKFFPCRTGVIPATIKS